MDIQTFDVSCKSCGVLWQRTHTTGRPKEFCNECRKSRQNSWAKGYRLTPEGREKKKAYEKTEAFRNGQTKVRGRRAEWMAEQKAKPCTDCKKCFHSSAMEWDHLPGQKKAACVAHMKLSTKERILAEIAKCDLVCANCHRIRTWTRREIKKHANKGIQIT